MPSITETLIWEHRGFCTVFHRIQVALPDLKLTELKQVAQQLDTMLVRHAAAEDDLVLLALNQAPSLKRRFERFHHQHQEINGDLTQVHSAKVDASQARKLLKEVMAYSRRHFNYEEQIIFPLLDSVVDLLTLDKLGALYLLQPRQARGEDPANLIRVDFSLGEQGKPTASLKRVSRPQSQPQ